MIFQKEILKRKKEIVKKLMREERAETDLVHIYLSLIKDGAVNCLPREQRQEFKEGIEKLHFESEKHMKIVFNLLERYNSQE